MEATIGQESVGYKVYFGAEYRLLWEHCEQGAVFMPRRTEAELSALERIYHADPNNEETCRELIAAYLSAGRRDDALRLCLSLNDRLEAVGKLPSEETRRLMTSLTASPQALPRSGWSRRHFVQVAALGTLAIGTMGVWQWKQRPAPSAIEVRSAESWETEGNRYAASAEQCYQKGNYTEGASNALRAVQCFQKSGNGKGEAGITLVLGECEQAMGNVWAANGYFAQGLRLHRLHSGKESIEHALELCGSLAVKQGRYSDAERCFKESIALSWQKNEKGDVDKGNILSVMCGQGLLAAETGHPADALVTYGRALGYARLWNDQPMSAYFQMLQGTHLLNYHGDTDESETLLNAAKAYWNGKADASPRWKAATNNRLAALRLAQNRLDAAQNCLAVSLPIYLNVQDKLGEADTRMLCGRLYLMQGRLEEAENELLTAQVYFDEQGLLPRAARCYLVMSALRTAQNRPADSRKERENADAFFKQLGMHLPEAEYAALLHAPTE